VPSSGAAALGRCRRRVRSSPHGRRRGRPGALPERAPARAGHRGRGLASVPVRRWPQRAPHVLLPDMPGDPLRAATRAVGQRDGPPHGSRAATVCGVIRAGRVTCPAASGGSAAIGTATSMEWGRPVACRAVTPGVISPRRWSGYSLRRSPTLAPLARTVPPCRPSPAVTPAVGRALRCYAAVSTPVHAYLNPAGDAVVVGACQHEQGGGPAGGRRCRFAPTRRPPAPKPGDGLVDRPAGPREAVRSTKAGRLSAPCHPIRQARRLYG